MDLRMTLSEMLKINKVFSRCHMCTDLEGISNPDQGAAFLLRIATVSHFIHFFLTMGPRKPSPFSPAGPTGPGSPRSPCKHQTGRPFELKR